jgi:hypothetical protein
MNAIITVFKIEFKDKKEIEILLPEMSDEVKEISDAFIYSPKPGKLMQFLSILKNHKIAYATHFNSRLEYPS